MCAMSHQLNYVLFLTSLQFFTCLEGFFFQLVFQSPLGFISFT